MYYHQFQSTSMLITEITIWRWMVHVCWHDYASFVFHTIVVKSPLTLIFTSPNFNFIFCQKFHGILFQFSLKVPQQLIVLRLEIRRNCPCTACSVLAVHLVTVASAAIIESVTHYRLSLNTQSYCNYIIQKHTPCRFLPQTACVSLVYIVWKWSYLWKAQWFHQLLNAW